MIYEVRSNVGSIEIIRGVRAGLQDGWLRFNIVGEPAPTANLNATLGEKPGFCEMICEGRSNRSKH